MNLTVKVSGPFFSLGPKPVLDSLHAAIQETVSTGERELVTMAQPRERGGVFHSGAYAAAHGYRNTGHYARSINGRMVGSLNGVISDSGVTYGAWLEGVSSRNQATRFKGYAMFRRTRDKLQKLGGEILNRHVRKALDRLR